MLNFLYVNTSERVSVSERIGRVSVKKRLDMKNAGNGWKKNPVKKNKGQASKLRGQIFKLKKQLAQATKK